jgi:4-hydroxy-tetrahydrodipicolinate reductase
MPLAALQLCERVDSVRVQEIFDYGTHPDPHWATPFGFGQPPEAPAPILTKGVPTLFWGGMVRLLADVVGGRLDELRETTERWVAPESFDTPMIHVAAGTVAAVRFEIAGVVAGRPALFAEHVTRMRPQAAPDWPQPPPGARGVHRVAIEGVPSLTLDLTLRGDRSGNTNAAGVLATAMRIVNAIPAVCAAPPGLVCARDLPLGGGRHWLAS